MDGALACILLFVLVIIIVWPRGGGSGSGNGAARPVNRSARKTIRCPYCGSPAEVKGRYWECGYCGDSGRM